VVNQVDHDVIFLIITPAGTYVLHIVVLVVVYQPRAPELPDQIFHAVGPFLVYDVLVYACCYWQLETFNVVNPRAELPKQKFY
jgi:hypothetical protein